MAYHISVFSEKDLPFVLNPPEDVFSEAFDLWTEEAESKTLYDNPLGSGHIIYRFWSAPAKAIGLHLIADIYDKGLIVSADQLGTLEVELTKLESYWNSIDLSGEEAVTITTTTEDGHQTDERQPFHEYLHERIGYLREAIEIARLNNGVIIVN